MCLVVSPLTPIPRPDPLGKINYAKDIEPYVAKEHVPKYFGGTMVDEEDENPFCSQKCITYGAYALKSEGIPEFLDGTCPRGDTW